MRAGAWRALGLAALALGVSAAPGRAQLPIALRFEAGLGNVDVRPLKAKSSPGGGVIVAVGLPVDGKTRGFFELATIGGGSYPGGVGIPEASRPGSRALHVAVLGVERASLLSGDGGFAALGAGIGRHTLDGARGEFAPPYGSNWIIPSRRLTAFAGSAGLGYRAIRPGASFQVALRAHAMFSAGEAPISSYLLTLGVAW